MHSGPYLIGDHTASLGQFRRFTLERTCQVDEGHRHHFDHYIQVIRGRIRVLYRDTADGPDKVLGEFGPLDLAKPLIKAGCHHTVKALEPWTVYDCTFTHRDFDGEVSQRFVGHPLEAEAAGV